MSHRAVSRTTSASPLSAVNVNNHQPRGRTVKAAASRTPSEEPVAKTKGAGRRKSASKRKKALQSKNPPMDSWTGMPTLFYCCCKVFFCTRVYVTTYPSLPGFVDRVLEEY
ncbi:unnamed protein product [Ectocarpus sp. CCAP 1310/34]|nr:unnamed protein product [Ectocarpus sp. CCAP 1310/34]